MNRTTTYPPQPPRYYNGGYRYFFNGQEADNEVLGEGSLAGYEFRQYDTRLGRWWGVDPDVSKFPGESPFLFCGGNPILYLDKYGRYKLPEKEAKKSAYSDRGLVFESDVYFYEGVSNMEEFWSRTIDNLQDAMEVVKEKSKTEEGRKDLPTVPKP